MRREFFFLALRIVLLFILLALPYKARATNPISVVSDEPFALRFTLPSNNVPYSAKIRFYDPSLDKYVGQTWNGNDWLDQSDSWTQFPVHDGGSTGFITGRISNPTPDMLLQIAVRKSGSSSTTLLQEFPITIRDGLGTLELASYTSNNPYVEGYFSITENTSERFVPLINNSLATTLRTTNQIAVGFYSSSGILLVSPAPYTLVPGIQHTITLNAPSPITYEGAITGPSSIFANQPVTYSLNLSPKYTGNIRWFLDGEPYDDATSSHVSPLFTRTSHHTITAYLTDVRQAFSYRIAVQSVPNIRIEKVLINPVGSDAKREEIVIKNNNPFASSITGWKLKSRTSSTSIPINGNFGPNQSLTFVVSNRLINKNAAYDLFTESNEIADTLFYETAPEGEYLERIGINWQPKNIAYVPNNSQEPVVAEGKVTKPRGNSIDIETPNGPLHIVVHQSFDGTKPRLRTGDVIRVSGIMRVSRNGPYLSVRAGDQFLLLSSAVRVSKKAQKALKPKSQLNKSTNMVIQKTTRFVNEKSPVKPLNTVTTILPTGPPNALFWQLFALMISFGGFLLFSPSFSIGYGILKDNEPDSIH